MFFSIRSMGKLGFLSFLFLMGCSSYQKDTLRVRQNLASGHPQEAAEVIRKKALTPGDDQLLFLLDYGLCLYESGKYKKSIQAFLRADDLVDFQDYISLSRSGGSFLLGEGFVQYKGDPFEKVLINVYLALNFLMLEQIDEAAVEVRKLNQRLDYLRAEGEKPFVQSALARYLGAMIWEEQGNWDSAYIDYKKTYNLSPKFSLLKKDLLRSSYRARRMSDYREWKIKFPEVHYDPKEDQKYGELVVIYQQGWAPRKRLRRFNMRFPELKSVPVKTQFARVSINEKPLGLALPFYSIGDIAIKTLESEYAALVARRLVGLVAKEVVSDQIRQKNEFLGNVAWLVANLADQADLRQWSTLPEAIHILRLPLLPGKYQLGIQGLDGRKRPTSERMEPRTLNISAGKKSFITWRSF